MFFDRRCIAPATESMLVPDNLAAPRMAERPSTVAPVRSDRVCSAAMPSIAPLTSPAAQVMPAAAASPASVLWTDEIAPVKVLNVGIVAAIDWLVAADARASASCLAFAASSCAR